MDKKGDHGGDSEQEISAGLFFYSKKPLTAPGKLDTVFQSLLQLDDDWVKSFLAVKESDGTLSRVIPQIDIVATLSVLMGVPIPFGNLGMLIPELFITTDDGNIQHLLELLQENAKQVNAYLEIYSGKRQEAQKWFQDSFKLFESFQKPNDGLSKQEQEALVVKYSIYFRSVLIKARLIWARFDQTLMIIGIILCVVAFFGSLSSKVAPPLMITSFLVGACIGFFGFLNMLTSSIIEPFHETLFFATLLPSLLHISRCFRFKIPTSFFGWLAMFICILYSFGVGSDSYTIWEDIVLLYLVQTVHSFLFLHICAKGERLQMNLVLVCAVIARVIGFITICRPDQGPFCIPTFNATPESSTAWEWAPLILGILLAVAYIIASTRLGIVMRIAYPLIASVVTSYWWLDTHAVANPTYAHLVWAISLLTFVILAVQKSNYASYFGLAFLNLVLFQKPMGGIALALGYIYIMLLRLMYTKMSQQSLQTQKVMDTDTSLVFLLTLLLALVGQMLFFSTGHQSVLASVQYETGFIGLHSANYALSPLFISLNTYGGIILVALAMPLFNFEQESIQIFGVSIVLFFVMLFQRHSQSYRVWGPKFLFSVGGFVIQAVIGLGVSIANFTNT